MPARTATAGLAVLVLALSACTGGRDEPAGPTTIPPATDSATTGDASPTPSATPGATPTTTGPTSLPPATDEPSAGTELPAPASEPQQSADFPGGGGDLLPTVVRIGRHDGFDRVVFDLEGSGTPGYRVEYVEEAIQDGSGNVVEVDGDAILAVVITGTRYPDEGEDFVAPATYEADGAENIEEVRLDGTFEGMTQGFIGLDSQVPFRVFTLSDPVRLVVDVAHDRAGA
ncbi:hypothetical protein V2J56_06370 [Georgenia sp. MJ206]|uniref:AMIN-like domain-containing (lipo)protein n=1 Tax=Georgenia wangjunii TaxID=3117730 RepID=UPI002F264E39